MSATSWSTGQSSANDNGRSSNAESHSASSDHGQPRPKRSGPTFPPMYKRSKPTFAAPQKNKNPDKMTHKIKDILGDFKKLDDSHVGAVVRPSTPDIDTRRRDDWLPRGNRFPAATGERAPAATGERAPAATGERAPATVGEITKAPKLPGDRVGPPPAKAAKTALKPTLVLAKKKAKEEEKRANNERLASLFMPEVSGPKKSSGTDTSNQRKEQGSGKEASAGSLAKTRKDRPPEDSGSKLFSSSKSPAVKMPSSKAEAGKEDTSNTSATSKVRTKSKSSAVVPGKKAKTARPAQLEPPPPLFSNPMPIPKKETAQTRKVPPLLTKRKDVNSIFKEMTCDPHTPLTAIAPSPMVKNQAERTFSIVSRNPPSSCSSDNETSPAHPSPVFPVTAAAASRPSPTVPCSDVLSAYLSSSESGHSNTSPGNNSDSCMNANSGQTSARPADDDDSDDGSSSTDSSSSDSDSDSGSSSGSGSGSGTSSDSDSDSGSGSDDDSDDDGGSSDAISATSVNEHEETELGGAINVNASRTEMPEPTSPLPLSNSGSKTGTLASSLVSVAPVSLSPAKKGDRSRPPPMFCSIPGLKREEFISPLNSPMGNPPPPPPDPDLFLPSKEKKQRDPNQKNANSTRIPSCAQVEMQLAAPVKRQRQHADMHEDQRVDRDAKMKKREKSHRDSSAPRDDIVAATAAGRPVHKKQKERAEEQDAAKRNSNAMENEPQAKRMYEDTATRVSNSKAQERQMPAKPKEKVKEESSSAQRDSKAKARQSSTAKSASAKSNDASERNASASSGSSSNHGDAISASRGDDNARSNGVSQRDTPASGGSGTCSDQSDTMTASRGDDSARSNGVSQRGVSQRDTSASRGSSSNHRDSMTASPGDDSARSNGGSQRDSSASRGSSSKQCDNMTASRGNDSRPRSRPACDLYGNPEEYLAKPASYYYQSARRIKHEADQMLSNELKAHKYFHACIMFLREGAVYEMRGDPDALKRARNSYTATEVLFRYVEDTLTKNKGLEELIVIAIRCRAIVPMRVFIMCKEKMHTDHKEMASEMRRLRTAQPIQPVSPWSVSSGGSSNSVASPQSPNGSSTASGNGTQPSAASGDTAAAKSDAPSNGQQNGAGVPPASPPNVAFPQSMVAVGTNYTNSVRFVLDGITHWQRANRRVTSSRAFFEDLDARCGRLDITSPMVHLIEWAQAGFDKAARSAQ